MKSMMNVFNTTMQKRKKKNRKGFSLVELIVVLVIMAILAAALVPTLIGYIRQTKESNVKNEASATVSAAQTIASSAFAAPDGKYASKAASGTDSVTLTIFTDAAPDSYTAAAIDSTGHTATSDDAKGIADTIELLAEVPGEVTSLTISGGKVTGLTYVSDGSTVTYNGSTYSVS